MTPDKSRYTILATDIVVFAIKDDALNVLLIKVKKDFYQGLWAVPGGLVKPSETLDASAKNKLYAVTGTKKCYIEQLYTFGKIDRDPQGRIVSVTYFALMPESDMTLNASEAYDDIDWFPIDRLPKLAYDHSEVVGFALERLRSKITYSNIIYGLLPDEFTLGELQNAYEIVLGRQLDKRNFRKKIISLNLVMRTEKRTSGKAHRPASLYRFKEKRPMTVQIL